SENPEYDIFYGKTLFVKPEAGEPRPFSPLAHAGLLHDMSVTHPAVFVTRKTYELHGTFNKKYRLAMDYDFLLRAMWQGAKFKFIDRHFSNFRMEGVSVRYYQESLVECSRIRKSVFVDKK
ncbi:MAG: hypothetical protein MI784_03850, partial [Cytophagales bacterium]|nr:hypothetical protein [Cytophagales bacterium]